MFSIPGPSVPWKKDVLRHKSSTFNYVSRGGGFETSFPAYLWLHHDPIISGFWSWLFKSGALAWWVPDQEEPLDWKGPPRETLFFTIKYIRYIYIYDIYIYIYIWYIHIYIYIYEIYIYMIYIYIWYIYMIYIWYIYICNNIYDNMKPLAIPRWHGVTLG